MKQKEMTQAAVKRYLRRAFARGVGSTVSIFGGRYRFTPGRSDAEALAGDWRRVGSYLSDAIETVKGRDR